MAHKPFFYATYQGPLPVARVGEGATERGYPAGQTILIGEDDATAIREQEQHAFDLTRVPPEWITTGDEIPTDATAAQELNRRILKSRHGIEV